MQAEFCKTHFYLVHPIRGKTGILPARGLNSALMASSTNSAMAKPGPVTEPIREEW